MPDLADEEQTQRFAARLAAVIHLPLTLTFRGDLGAGKTTLVRALLRALGVQGAIKSPTFSLVESYSLATDQWAHHFDLYRIEQESELELIGFRDYFAPNSLCCIEWPERAGKQLEAIDVDFSLHVLGAGRGLDISAHSSSGQALMAMLLCE